MMRQRNPVLRSRIRASSKKPADLRKANQQLQAHVNALVEDNRQLRAALRIFSEVARRSPPVLPWRSGRVA